VRLYHRDDRGEPIRDIQGRLSALGFSVSGDSRGVFGENTERAVAAFQRQKGLDGDGIVGPDTWRALVDAGHRLGDRLLYHRVPMMRGDDVADLQSRLNALGFDAGRVDGIFGPDTQRALLDFQANRGMGEDGIAGTEAAAEPALMERATQKPGRDSTRERMWLDSLPPTIAGQRIYVDPACRNDEEAAATWDTALGLSAAIQESGAHPLISRSADTTPPERLRARRANRLDVHLVVSLSQPGATDSGIFYFASEYSRSAAGESVAHVLSSLLELPASGRAVPILKETRSPAIVVAVAKHGESVGADIGDAIARAFVELTAQSRS
jgi:N-acetylmuramoyl-L-alanine amidase